MAAAEDDYHSESDEDYRPSGEEEAAAAADHEREEGEDEEVEEGAEGSADKRRSRKKAKHEPKPPTAAAAQPVETEAQRKARLDALFLAELSLPAPAPKPAPRPAFLSAALPPLTSQATPSHQPTASSSSSSQVPRAAPPNAQSPTPQSPTPTTSASAAAAVAQTATAQARPTETIAGGKVEVTRTFKFAGDTINVVESVDARTAARLAKKEAQPDNPLQSLLGAIGPKKTMTTLAKSQLDWDGYKKEEGLADTLKQSHSFLDKMEFLQRADERQHEHELQLRGAQKRK